MKLYDVPPESFIRYADIIDLYFCHIDGMYSLCYNHSNEPVHLVAWAEVEVLDDKPESWKDQENRLD